MDAKINVKSHKSWVFGEAIARQELFEHAGKRSEALYGQKVCSE